MAPPSRALALLVAMAAAAPAATTSSAQADGRGPFTTSGSKVFDAQGNWVVFKGIGLTCTEYMARPNMPVPAGAAGRLEDWPGEFGWHACFGGAPAPNATLALNGEINNVVAYLSGSNFALAPTVLKAPWPAPFNEVLSPGSPRVVPLVRIPLTSATFLFDDEANEIGASGYRRVIDLLVQNLTSQGIAVILDHHGCCADGGKLNCSSRGGPMALRDFGEQKDAAVRFWAAVAATYASNPLVLFELYNEPHVWYQALYGGDPLYAGMAEMYAAVRNASASNLVIIGGTGYAQDAAGLLALSQQFVRDSGKPLSNVLLNLHPYQGAYQGVWISLRSTMRLTLALQTIAPVIWTELGQYCCNTGTATSCQTPGLCNDHAHGDFFVHNVINLAAQLDVSWTGWAWRGNNSNGGACKQGQAECNSPDMRDVGGVLTDGSSGGANWSDVWATFVAPATLTVQDRGDPSKIGVNDTEVQGFLPLPCIVPMFGMGSACGWPLGAADIGPWTSLWNQSVADSVLPGLPPSGAPNSCTEQACAGYSCSPDSPIVPMPTPCA